ncbi:MAG: flippase [Gulosibacter sp.]|uniref:flippase n=1 Tax=Gulosibacter sp. TaxID=2817531 RepID=UPI003F937874
MASSTPRSGTGSKPGPSLTSDTTALFALRVIGTGVPLIAIPVMSRALGPAGYGEVAIGLAVYSLLATASMYGFLISANRQVALADGDRTTIQRTIQNVLTYQLILAAIALLGFLVTLIFVQIPWRLQIMVLASIVSILIGAFFPSWAFQGLRMLKEGAVVEVASRLLMVGILALLVRTPEDTLLAFFTQVFWVIPAGIYAVIRFGVKGFYTRKRLVTRASFHFTLADGLAPFLNNVFFNIYTALNTVILGAIAGPASVANYTGADKLTLAARMPADPIQQAVFPRLVRSLNEHDQPASARLSRILFWSTLTVMSAATVFCVIFGPAVLHWYLGPGYELAGDIVRVLALALPLVAIASWAETLLQAAGHARRSTIGVGAGLVAHIVYILPVVLWLGGIGVAIAVVITEAIITAVMLLQLRKVSPRFSVVSLFPVKPSGSEVTVGGKDD